MIFGIPRSAAALGAAGLIPFVAGTLATMGLLPGVSNPITGYLILQGYGAAILAFMGGCLWGFAAEAERGGWTPYALSVLPGLWAAATTFLPLAWLPVDGLTWLAVGFALLQVLDIVFRRRGLGPRWWLALRLPLTVGVIVCLLAGAQA